MLLADGSRGSRRSGSESEFNRKDRKRKKERNRGKKGPVELSLLFAATTTTNKEDDHHGVFLFGAADPDPDTIIDQVSYFKY